ncbi:MAG: MerR family transcriptional regulator [Candidatus Schekmanbacteria bacterium]|nr:MerR family transcriptional regulator [Candidatus Schekmanbacteria bacterium]
MTDDFLTISEIARRLNLPPSTASYYAKRFAEFIPSSGDGRRKRYGGEAVDVLQTIAESLRCGMTSAQIAHNLGRSFPMTIDTTSDGVAAMPPGAAPPADSAQKLVRAMIDVQDRLALGLERLAGNREDFAAIDRHLTRQRRSVKHLRCELARQNESLGELRREVAELRVDLAQLVSFMLQKPGNAAAQRRKAS